MESKPEVSVLFGDEINRAQNKNVYRAGDYTNMQGIDQKIVRLDEALNSFTIANSLSSDEVARIGFIDHCPVTGLRCHNDDGDQSTDEH